MYSIALGKQIVKRYKLQWHSYNGKRYYVSKTRILHSVSLQDVKNKAKRLFALELPDNIQRV